MAFQNFFAAKLFTDIGAGDISITLDTAPVVTSGRMVLEARNPTQREVIKYTGVSGNQLTGVTRAQGGTTAKPHLKNALIEMNMTAEDLQDLYDGFASFVNNATDWRPLINPPSTVTYNGQRSYDLVFNGVDYTGVLNPGTRLRTTRTVAAPTRCTILNGTNQYWVKTSPAGMTFTDDFVVSAWVKLSSYPGSEAMIVSRSNNVSGWFLDVLSNGTVFLNGTNGAAANYSRVTTYQSLPLNKWVHITAQLDMSAFTASSTTSYIMFDGVDVPVSVSRAGTNPTALINNVGNLEVGSFNGGTLPFPGKIAQAAIFNAKVTQATMRTYMSQGLVGTETSLISAYSFNNSTTDLNVTNANNLTAGAGSPTATNADSPFGTQASGLISSTLDYGIIQVATFSTNTTVTVQVPEGCTIPTSGGVSAISYSGVKAPYGFPAQIDKWVVEYINVIQLLQSGASNANWYNIASRLSVPTGSWSLKYEGLVLITNAGATNLACFATLSTSPTVTSDSRFTALTPSMNISLAQTGQTISRTNTIVVTVATIYYMNLKPTQNSSTIYWQGSDCPITIQATNGYL